MAKEIKSPGPIERMLVQSDNPQLQRLCQMNNLELLDYMDELSAAGENFDETLYNAAEQLLDERAPIEQPSAEEFIQSWRGFKAKHPELYQPETIHPAKQAKRTYTLRRSLAVAALIAALALGLAVGALAATNMDFQDLGEVVMRNIKYGSSGSLESVEPLDEGYVSFAEAINATGGDGIIETPTWVPSDLALTNVMTTVNENGQCSYWAHYESSKRSLLVVIYKLEEMPIMMEKNSDTTVEQMKWHGSDYLIVSNTGYVNCEWDKNGYSYSVAGSITTDELRSVVKSFK